MKKGARRVLKVLDYKDQMGTEFTLPYSSTLVLDLGKLNLLASWHCVNLQISKDFSICASSWSAFGGCESKSEKNGRTSSMKSTTVRP